MKKLGKIKTLAIASLSVVALAVPVALAQSNVTEQSEQQVSRGDKGGRRGGKHRGHRGGRMRGMMMKGINLTDAQKAQMKQIKQSFRERTQPLRQELRAKRQELRQASEGGTFNESLATQKLTETAALRAKLMGERFKLKQELQAVLTAEQKAQIEQKRAEFKAKRAEFKAKRAERGAGQVK
jgi:protein CpxP